MVAVIPGDALFFLNGSAFGAADIVSRCEVTSSLRAMSRSSGALQRLDCAYRVDLLVEGMVVIELKTVAKLEPVHFAQMMTCLKFSGCDIGLLINFNVTRLIDEVRRVVHGYDERASLNSDAAAISADVMQVGRAAVRTESIAERAE